jgi:hypothetical protein
MQANKNLIILLGILTLISVLISISGCVNPESDACAGANVTKFGKSVEIIFANETFEGIWNGKVMSGEKGEQAMDWYANQRGWTRIDDEKSPHSSGIDGIYKKSDKHYIFVEAKETSRKNDYDTPLSTDASYGPQMSDQWIEYHLVKINNSGLLTAFYDGDYEKLAVVYKIKDYPGSTITKDFADSLSSVGINNVVIIKQCGANT